MCRPKYCILIDDLVPKFQALESEAVLGRFRAVYEKMNLALDGMPYSEIGISDEVKEQVNICQHFGKMKWSIVFSYLMQTGTALVVSG